jgi:hypothetical protein
VRYFSNGLFRLFGHLGFFGFSGHIRNFSGLFRTFQDFSGLFRTFQDFSGLLKDTVYIVI